MEVNVGFALMLTTLAHSYGREHLVIAGAGAGMLIMAFSLFMLR